MTTPYRYYSKYMVFDVESIGLHGEGFAVGWVVCDAKGEELSYGAAHCFPDEAAGELMDRLWVSENCTFLHDTAPSAHNPREVRDIFWRAWIEALGSGSVLVADCPFPVEANFLAKCLEDRHRPKGTSPYPFLDVSSVLIAAGIDPLTTFARLPRELPAHDPLNDARQSARILFQAFRVIDDPTARGIAPTS